MPLKGSLSARWRGRAISLQQDLQRSMLPYERVLLLFPSRTFATRLKGRHTPRINVLPHTSHTSGTSFLDWWGTLFEGVISQKPLA